MVEIYISVDAEGFVSGYGNAEYGAITADPEDSILLEVEESHELFTQFDLWKYVDGELIKDDSREIARLAALEKEKHTPTEAQRIQDLEQMVLGLLLQM